MMCICDTQDNFYVLIVSVHCQLRVVVYLVCQMAKFKKLSKPGSSMIFTFNIMVHFRSFFEGNFQKTPQ